MVNKPVYKNTYVTEEWTSGDKDCIHLVHDGLLRFKTKTQHSQLI